MSKQVLEKVAIGLAVVVLVSAAWFWTLQVGDVIELLETAYGS